MATEQQKAAARQVFKTLLNYMDKNDLNYSVVDSTSEEYVIQSTFNTQDFPVECSVRVYPTLSLIVYMSFLPFKIPAEKLAEVSVALQIINSRMLEGCFYIITSDGSIIFRTSSNYIGSLIGEDVFNDIILLSTSQVDTYNDKLFMLAKGMITLEQFQNSLD